MGLFEKSHSIIEMPDEEELLWRYISLARYIQFLETSHLWFSRVDQFKDKFEGSVTPYNLILRQQAEGQFSFLRESGMESLTSEVRKGKRNMGFANCWHSSQFESDSMWQKYPTSETVVLVSDRSHFRNGIASDRDVYLGKVVYKNYLPGTSDYVDDMNIFGPLFTKRNNFEFEKEVRAVLLDDTDKNEPISGAGNTREFWSLNPIGIGIGVDLNLLLKEVRVHPGGGKEFLQTVKNISHKYGLTAEVKDSEMNAEPLF